jgi:S1-C subfamily serine protease
MANAFLNETRGSAPQRPADVATLPVPRPSDPPASQSPPEKSKVPKLASGTGIEVDSAGHVLTNFHVVDGCEALAVKRGADLLTKAEVVAVDPSNDLALLKHSGAPTSAAAKFRLAPPIRAGDDVVVFGFPLALSGDVSVTGNVVVGNVSSLSGPGEDSSLMQTSAPIQPGNSGGPLMDRSGYVVGVVRLKLKDAANVGFAIKSSLAMEFLGSHGVQFETATMPAALDVPTVAENARKFTNLVVCIDR